MPENERQKSFPYEREEQYSPTETFTAKGEGGKETSPSFEETVPRWGGNGVYQGVRVCLGNTCPLDNLMYVFYRIMTERPDIFFLIQQEQHPVCRYLVELKRLGEEGRWADAKIDWLSTFCDFKVDLSKVVNGKTDWNAYGSEYNTVTRHLGDIQCSRQRSRCSEETCPDRFRSPQCNDISLR